jgi:hypothetical protein
MAEATASASLVDAVEAHLAAQAVAGNGVPAGGLDDAVDSGSRATAAAVLDILRASGWVDASEAGELRRELDRLRELLDLVVRDHRAREADAAEEQVRQRDWLIPLLRAADGMEQGTLEAKATLRAAVLQVPADLLQAAGLRQRAVPQPYRAAATEPPHAPAAEAADTGS